MKTMLYAPSNFRAKCRHTFISGGRSSVDKRRADLVHEYFGVGFAGEVVVLVVEQFLAKFHVIGQLAVEGETEPLVFFDVVAFEGLGVTAVVGAAGGVAHVPDGRPAGVFPHDRLALVAVAEAEDLVDVAHVFIGVDDLLSAGIIRGDAGGKLAAVLNVQQHAGHQPGNLFRPLLGTQGTFAPAGQMIDRRHSAFFVQVAHKKNPALLDGNHRYTVNVNVSYPGVGTRIELRICRI